MIPSTLRSYCTLSHISIPYSLSHPILLLPIASRIKSIRPFVTQLFTPSVALSRGPRLLFFPASFPSLLVFLLYYTLRLQSSTISVSLFSSRLLTSFIVTRSFCFQYSCNIANFLHTQTYCIIAWYHL
ncbi:uncharacterized protein C8R40DRAFT_281402 [Lentinula edodes]|uniref:uncharacterized protein n=1 Tax=Lentinula edodes TaxID=5353 RepID=UPI001E8D27BC|nr:uncharacterized protein C8R40DRAFT_281402 [Lentinula edodes]KAH7880765.1 hypothetical protein C8R40DRAFT_281402 [Lentinula edodes]